MTPAGTTNGPPQLRTQRLLLRTWREEDLEPFAALNADARVMEHFPAPLDRAASDALAARAQAGLEERGWGLWAVEVLDLPGSGRAGLAGFVGLAPATFEASFTPATEVGWRLARWAWGRGYATEAATRVLDLALRSAASGGSGKGLGLAEVVSFTATTNLRSQAVMTRIGMHRDRAGDFDHPSVPPGSPLRRHVLYRVARR